MCVVAPFPSLVTGFQKSGLTILLKSLQNSWESRKTMVAAATTKSVDSKVKTVLVTGATSMVGKELVKELSTNTKNIRIKAAGRSEENVKRIINSDKVESIRFDYARPETLREAVRDVDSIFLITPFQSDMVELTSNLLRYFFIYYFYWIYLKV